MTPADLDAALIPWIRRADILTTDRIADAAAHARLGDLTTSARRLVELHHGLAGPNGTGLIGDARAAAYRAAHAGFDPDIHDPDRQHPTSEGESVARTAPIGDRDAHRELGGLIDQARQGLVTASASLWPVPDVAVSTAIDTWHAQHSAAIRAWVRRTLSDGQVAVHSAVSHHRIKPELR